jgi:hypothetical protein
VLWGGLERRRHGIREQQQLNQGAWEGPRSWVGRLLFVFQWPTDGRGRLRSEALWLAHGHPIPPHSFGGESATLPTPLTERHLFLAMNGATRDRWVPHSVIVMPFRIALAVGDGLLSHSLGWGHPFSIPSSPPHRRSLPEPPSLPILPYTL